MIYSKFYYTAFRLLRANEDQGLGAVFGWRRANELPREKSGNGQKAVFLTFIMLLWEQWAGFLPTEANHHLFLTNSMKSFAFTRFANSLLVMVSLASGLSSCKTEDSANVNQDRIYADYSLVYDKAEDKTYARAAFKFGSATGTPLQVQGPSEVRIGPDVAAFVPLLNYYEKTYAGLQNQVTFTFKDLNGKTFTNTISGQEPVALPTNFTSLTKGSAYTLTWTGAPVRQAETVDVALDGAGQSDPIQVFLQPQVGATSLILDAARIGTLLNGPGKASISRTRIEPLQQGTGAGGSLITRYQGQSQTVNVQ
jgi:hypothetical protein